MIFAPIPTLFFVLSSVILCYYTLDSPKTNEELNNKKQIDEEKALKPKLND